MRFAPRRTESEAHLAQPPSFVSPFGCPAAVVGVYPRRRGDSYSNNFLAFFRVNRQSILVRFWLAPRFQALVSRFSVPRSGILRVPRHCREYRLSSISA